MRDEFRGSRAVLPAHWIAGVPASLAGFLTLACAAAPAVPSGPPPATSAPPVLSPRESAFLARPHQLTFGGENAEAYFSFDGRRLSMQSRHEDRNEGCDRIYTLDVPSPQTNGTPAPRAISSGLGATTCAHYFPDGQVLFASTHLAGPVCPPKPDMRQGYVWALYDSYDIFKVDAEGRNPRRLTREAGYDAEATVCGKDGSIVFTSTRDGDIELYRMDAEGRNVKRLTHAVGYDGGAFFNADCSKIVWRASRPAAGSKEEADFKRLLGLGLVRPSKLELFIANADGSEAMQLTYLDAASFAPFFHPTQPLVIFASNHGDPRGREFDLWAIGTDGSRLTRVTDTPGFDGFPHFSPDGKRLLFASNRATAPGRHDTNVFIADWTSTWPPAAAEEPSSAAASRIIADIAWLADPAREGRGVGTRGLDEAGAFLEQRMRDLGLEGAGNPDLAPAGTPGFRQAFEMTTGVRVAETTRMRIAGQDVARADFTVMGFSTQATARGALALFDYGVVDSATARDDYRGKSARNKIVLVRRFAPEGEKYSDTEIKRRLGDLRHKAFLARERGARALVVVDWPMPPTGAAPDSKPPSEAPLPEPSAPGPDDAGIPVLVVKRQVLEPFFRSLEAGRSIPIELTSALVFDKKPAWNVIGRLRAGRPGGAAPIVIGAHYDHLGYGHSGSLAPDSKLAHVGADDNASGTATVLEIARALAARRDTLERDVIFILFSGEEWGLIGSSHFVRARAETIKELHAMINLDMVGRLRGNKVQVYGVDTASEWNRFLLPACAGQRVTCDGSGGGYGPSDQAAFYPAGVPVLHFFTGSHADYHKPTDTAARINAAGAAAIGRVVEDLVIGLPAAARFSFQKVASPAPRGDLRSFNASLGTVPDYAGPPGGQKGVLLSGVRPGSAAERADLRRGDVLVRLGSHEIRAVQDLMFSLNASKPGETVNAVVRRDGKNLTMPVTFEESRRAR